MAIYIRSAQSISPQTTFLQNNFPQELLEYEGRMRCVLPDFKNYFPPIQIRRMNYVLKTGNACAIEAIKAAGIEKPDAIIVGTGLGCVEDTEKFLFAMIDRNEGLLTPTTFIQSIHNTVGGNIALFHQANGHNLVYAHKTISFESALLDGMLMLKEKDAKYVLVGGADEITEESFRVKKIVNMYRDGISNKNLLKDKGDGAIAGEGIAFFVITDEESDENLAQFKGLDFKYKLPNNDALFTWLDSFLEKNNTKVEDIDVVFVGINGDKTADGVYNEFLSNNRFENATHAYYKNMCGEYDTASSFASWVAAQAISNGALPDYLKIKDALRTPRNILIYNQDNSQNHSLILLSKN